MWEINVTNQITTFVLSLCLGGLLCAFCDLLRVAHKLGLDSFWAVFLSDIFFGISSAFITFIFLMARTNGEIRGFALFGQFAGFVLFRITFSRLFFKLLCFLFANIARAIGFIRNKTNTFYEKLEVLILKIFKKCCRFFTRTLKSVKKLLKNAYKLLYTNKNISKME